MKKTILTGIVSASAVLMLGITSCGDDYSPAGSATGRITPLVDLQAEPLTAQDQGSRADSRASSVTVDDLKLHLVSADGAVNKTYDSYKVFPTNEDFKIGTYTLSASYGNADDIGFEKPYYYGEQQIKVESNQETRVDLTATLANSMVSVAYTDAFKNYMTGYSATLQKETTPFSYTSGENRPVYLKAGTVTLHVAFTKPNGKGGELEVARFTAAPRHHYRFTVDVNEGNVGDATMVVTLDDTFTEENISIDLSDELLNAPAPTITTSGFTPGEAVEVIGNIAPAEGLKMDVIARGKIRSVNLTTKCSSLIADGWPAEIDLIAADASQQALLQQLGLKTLGVWNNPDQMAVLDFTGVAAVVTTPAEFTVSVTDVIGKTVETPVTLAVTPVPVTIGVSDVQPLDLYATQLSFTLSTNAVDPASLFAFEVKNNRGTWDKVAATVTPVSRAADAPYKVVMTVPATEDDVTFRVVYNSKVTSENVAVHRAAPDFTVSVTANNSFATKAFVDFNRASAPASIKVEASTDGGATWNAVEAALDGAYINLTGLTPATTYKVRVAADGKYAHSFPLTTEAATQLPNAGMEEWKKVDGKTSYWWINYPAASVEDCQWGTMNLYTTSEGGSNTNAISGSRDGMAYCANSGTRSTNDKHNGNYAAEICTVGWGKGNSIGGSWASCKHLTPGELFLGTATNIEAQNYGMAFASRPSMVRFYYKYAPQNSADYGLAEVKALDAAGNVIAEGSKKIEKMDSYDKGEIPLTYKLNGNTIDKLVVIFKSSDNPDCLTANKTNIKDFTATGTSNSKEFLGSKLYIDDIELIY